MWVTLAGLAALVATLYAVYQVHHPRYDADYAGAQVCGQCHTDIYPRWQGSPHANMTRTAAAASVVGDFDNHRWLLPAAARRGPLDELPLAKMYQQDDHWFMAARFERPRTGLRRRPAK